MLLEYAQEIRDLEGLSKKKRRKVGDSIDEKERKIRVAEAPKSKKGKKMKRRK